MSKGLQVQPRIRRFIRSVKQRRLILAMSLIIGILSGLAAILLKNLTHFVEEQSTRVLFGSISSDIPFFLPLVGIFLSVIFVKYVVKQDIGHGVSKILFAISKRKGHLKPHNTWSSMVASSLTVGLGGSVGLEAPIVLTGASIGSNIGRLLKLNYKTVVLLVGCGAAGAIAGIFKAPIAALVFAIEVLMLDLTTWSIVPLLLSSVTAATLSYFLLGDEVVFSFTISEHFVLTNFPYYVLLGVFTGLISLYFTRMNNWVEHTMGRIKKPYVRTLTGGLLVSALIFMMPQLFGEGYIALQTLLTGHSSEMFNGTFFEGISHDSHFVIIFFVMLIIFKVIAMALTTGSGGVGGIFAPSLFVGGMSGIALAKILNTFTPITVSENNFSLVGMAGVMSGVMHAPLTGIFLIAEITGGYDLFIPLIITATIAYLTILGFERESIYTMRLAQRGELMTHHKDKQVLSMMTIKDVLEKDFQKVPADGKLIHLVQAISKSKRNIFPVVNDERELVGIIRLDDIRDIIFNTELYEKVRITELMSPPQSILSINERMENVLEIFEQTDSWNLPVVSENNHYMGFISRSKIFTSYRNLLKEFSDD